MRDLLRWTIEDMLEAQRKGQMSALDIVSAHLEQIARYNANGLHLRAVVEVNPDALAIAAGLDRDREHGVWRGPLHGIPILVKDNIDTGDAMHTTAGALVLAEHRAPVDATVAAKLRQAGAVIIGKANLTEWANFMSDNMPNGYSARGGQTLNPYGPGRFDVGGSSAGSGSGVAAGFAIAAIGTETSGSILSPSNNNSLVGIKPTVGLVSRRGIIPISMSQDTAGPMTRTVTDAAILLQVIAGPDEADAATHGTAHVSSAFTRGLKRGGLFGARIGVPSGYYQDGLSDGEKQLFSNVVDTLEAQGAVLVQDIELPTPEENENIDVMVHEFKVALNHYLHSVEPWLPARSLADVIAWNVTHADEALRYEQAMLERSEATSGLLTEHVYLERRLRDLTWSRKEGIDGTLRAHRLDALLFPSYYGCSIAAKAGYPSITVPAGYAEDGKPFGMTLTASAFSEQKLIHLAFDYEQATNHRIPPVMG